MCNKRLMLQGQNVDIDLIQFLCTGLMVPTKLSVPCLHRVILISIKLQPGELAVECPCLLVSNSKGWADFLSNPVLLFSTDQHWQMKMIHQWIVNVALSHVGIPTIKCMMSEIFPHWLSCWSHFKVTVIVKRLSSYFICPLYYFYIRDLTVLDTALGYVRCLLHVSALRFFPRPRRVQNPSNGDIVTGKSLWEKLC